MTSTTMTARLHKWTAITGLTVAEIHTMAAKAAAGYRAEETLYGSGYMAGETHSDALPGNPSDSRIQAWGDFLIDLGEAARR